MRAMKECIYRAVGALRSVPAWQLVGRGLAVGIVVLLLLQLFSFEKMPELLVQLGVGEPWNIALAIILVVAELLTVPFLLRMNVSTTVRRCSESVSVATISLLTVLEVMGLLSAGGVMFGAYTQRVPVVVRVAVMFGLIMAYGYYKYNHDKRK